MRVYNKENEYYTIYYNIFSYTNINHLLTTPFNKGGCFGVGFIN